MFQIATGDVIELKKDIMMSGVGKNGKKWLLVKIINPDRPKSWFSVFVDNADEVLDGQWASGKIVAMRYSSKSAKNEATGAWYEKQTCNVTLVKGHDSYFGVDRDLPNLPFA